MQSGLSLSHCPSRERQKKKKGTVVPEENMETFEVCIEEKSEEEEDFEEHFSEKIKLELLVEEEDLGE